MSSNTQPQPPSRTRASIAVAPPNMSTGAHVPGISIIFEGWVLKKRRKKMQGFARRYFTLFHTGILSYAFEPGQPIRDQVSLHHAAISTAPGRKDIHIDSNNATFHLKCLSTEDFDHWMTALRTFMPNTPDGRKSVNFRHSRQGSLGYVRPTVAIEEMGSAIAELDSAVHALINEVAHIKTSSSYKAKHDVFGLFKKSEYCIVLKINGTMPDPAAQLVVQQRVEEALDAMKIHYALLLRSANHHPHTPFDQSQSSLSSPLPTTAEEDETYATRRPRSRTSVRAASRAMKRASTGTSISDAEWFDAMEGDGPEEYVLDSQGADGTSTEPPSRILTNDSRSSLGQDHSSNGDTDFGEPEPGTPHPSDADKPYNLHVVRRAVLPSPVVGDEGSLFAVLKKNVGKDLSSIVMPVTFNEPLTLLQRTAEELEYHDLLSQAAATSDPVERLCFVAAFAVSGYAHTRHRSGRKGFNPMLAETFEDVRMKLIAEKVRHQPVVMAYHAEGQGWELNATSSGRTKFWGKSLEIIPLGITRVTIGDDSFEWKKPSSFLRNMMVGTKYLEHCGKMTIENTTTGARCVLDFKQSGYWGATNLVSGVVHSPSGAVVSQLDGKWDDQLAQTFDSEHFRMLWRVSPYPKNIHEYYGFTSFGITLNEITSDIEGKLPPTDSRFRPDVRALEEGDLDRAEDEKLRVEEMQRERRRGGKDRQPRWFREEGEEWVYTGGYWEARAAGWKGSNADPLW
ncbi:hypothetical protein CCMSSC00406_0000306 [Pleurotus cornucopiae]|uniref:Uncharacterized protein n=1 Tax=Pleurotus cornucopiae TaxID=5321 RepID=A0ACB7IZ19_PLECO|nr:hypothetical protein CCMSSC00406_0000306 [Pleurotus cornucopiae]